MDIPKGYMTYKELSTFFKLSERYVRRLTGEMRTMNKYKDAFIVRPNIVRIDPRAFDRYLKDWSA